MPKRARDAGVVDAPASSAQSSASASQNPREKKRTRVIFNEAGCADVAATAVQPPSKAGKPFKDTLTSSKKSTGAPAQPSVLNQPKKRVLLPGKLNKLAVSKPVSLQARSNSSGSTKADVNRRGNKVNKSQGTGGFASAPVETAEDLGVPAGAHDAATAASVKGKGKQKDGEAVDRAPNAAELWITRRTSYPAYLRAAVAAFVDKGHHTATLRALGAAIPVCLSLAMACRDALPCGAKGTTLEIRTGSVDVNDEIVPNDDSEGEDLDIQYQVRTKSSIECTLSLKKEVKQRLLVKSTGVSLHRAAGAREMGVRPGRGGRARSIRGGRGRGRARGK